MSDGREPLEVLLGAELFAALRLRAEQMGLPVEEAARRLLSQSLGLPVQPAGHKIPDICRVLKRLQEEQGGGGR